MIIEIEVNGRRIKAKKGELILETLKANGIYVPTLCHMEEFKPSGACRICVVEVEGRDDLVPACSHHTEEWMKIRTHSGRVLEARRTILELLLANHNDGCLTCDRGRWCRLQELASELNISGSQTGLPGRPKKADLTSPAIIRDPSKCILCGRCVRVCEETQMVAALDFIRRGSQTEVGTVLNRGLNYSSCIQCGQCIQVCPTGALRERSHVDAVASVLQNESKIVVALVEPALYVTLGEFFGMKPGRDFSSIFVSALKRAGFSKVYGTGWGIEHQAGLLAGWLTDRNGRSDPGPLIQSECPAVVRYICQSRQERIPALAGLKPGRQLMTRLVREQVAAREGRPLTDVSVVLLTSCTAVKEETVMATRMKDSTWLPDFSLTTREVYRLIRLFGINLENLEPEYREDLFEGGGRSGHLSAVSGGYTEMLTRILKARFPDSRITGEKPGKLKVSREMRETVVEREGTRITLASISGMEAFVSYLNDVSGKGPKFDFLEVMACQHGCINGGGQPCREADRNLRPRVKALMEWDEQYSVTETRPYLGVPGSEPLSGEELRTEFTPRSVFK